MQNTIRFSRFYAAVLALLACSVPLRAQTASAPVMNRFVDPDHGLTEADWLRALWRTIHLSPRNAKRLSPRKEQWRKRVSAQIPLCPWEGSRKSTEMTTALTSGRKSPSNCLADAHAAPR